MFLEIMIDPHISPEDFEESRKGHRSMVPIYMDLLRSHDDNTWQPRQMEFFFYGPTKEKAEGLRKDLEKLGYEVYGVDKSSNGEWSVIGLTTEFSFEVEVEGWSDKMCEMAFINDCKFDGWGTISEM